jgi:hypothetical protein
MNLPPEMEQQRHQTRLESASKHATAMNQRAVEAD